MNGPLWGKLQSWVQEEIVRRLTAAGIYGRTIDGSYIRGIVPNMPPNDADYLVGTAQAGLSAEIVVGVTPGGELGGTWASPTVDATHSGSAHHSQVHDIDGADHNGFPGGATTFLRADGTFATPSSLAFEPVTNGDITTPEIIFDALGDVIMVGML